MTVRPVFRVSAWDAIPAFCGIAIVGLILWSFCCFNSLSWFATVVAFVAVTASYGWNLQSISHNFIHNPFFSNVWLNRAFGVMESVAIGVPHVLYRHYHLNHHFGDNDKKGPTGTTKDWSSIYRYGKGDQPESFWRYSVLSFFRVEVRPVIGVAARHGNGEVAQLGVESFVLGTFWTLLVAVNWRYFVFFYLPSYYLGWVLSYAEGYLEHFGAKPGNPYANSVSSYNRLYNWLSLNNGYHQEHHWDPKLHWTQMHRLHEEIRTQLATNGTRTLRGPHLTALIEDYLTRPTAGTSVDGDARSAA